MASRKLTLTVVPLPPDYPPSLPSVSSLPPPIEGYLPARPSVNFVQAVASFCTKVSHGWTPGDIEELGGKPVGLFNVSHDFVRNFGGVLCCVSYSDHRERGGDDNRDNKKLGRLGVDIVKRSYRPPAIREGESLLQTLDLFRQNFTVDEFNYIVGHENESRLELAEDTACEDALLSRFSLAWAGRESLGKCIGHGIVGNVSGESLKFLEEGGIEFSGFSFSTICVENGYTAVICVEGDCSYEVVVERRTFDDIVEEYANETALLSATASTGAATPASPSTSVLSATASTEAATPASPSTSIVKFSHTAKPYDTLAQPTYSLALPPPHDKFLTLSQRMKRDGKGGTDRGLGFGAAVYDSAVCLALALSDLTFLREMFRGTGITTTENLSVLELGCGPGLVGLSLACQSHSWGNVIITDGDEGSVVLTVENLKKNKDSLNPLTSVNVQRFLWGSSTSNIVDALGGRPLEVIIGSDIIACPYMQYFSDLQKTINELKPLIVVIARVKRDAREGAFFERLKRKGWSVRMLDEKFIHKDFWAEKLGEKKIDIFVLSRADSLESEGSESN